MFPSVSLGRLILIFAWCILSLVFGVEFVRLLEDPTISVGMVCRSPRSTVDLTYFVQDFGEVRQLVPVIFGGGFF